MLMKLYFTHSRSNIKAVFWPVRPQKHVSVNEWSLCVNLTDCLNSNSQTVCNELISEATGCWFMLLLYLSRHLFPDESLWIKPALRGNPPPLFTECVPPTLPRQNNQWTHQVFLNTRGISVSSRGRSIRGERKRRVFIQYY